MLPSFVSFQINFTSSCATVISLSLCVLVTWGSVWPKIQGVLKKAHRGRHPPAIKTHTHRHTPAHACTHTKKHSHRNTMEKWKDKSKGMTACFSPNAPNQGLSDVALKVTLHCDGDRSDACQNIVNNFHYDDIKTALIYKNNVSMSGQRRTKTGNSHTHAHTCT